MRKGPVEAVMAVLALLALGFGGFVAAARMGAFSIPLQELRQRYETPHSRYVRLDGVDLHINDRGKGPVILLVHGHYQSLRIWNRWADALSPRYRIITIDMPPYGLSGHDSTGKYSPQRVEQLIALLAPHEGLRRFTIGGISTGSAIAMRYSLQHPDQIDALILVNAPLVPIAPGLQPKTSGMLSFLETYLFRPIYRPQAFYRYLLGRLIANKQVLTEDLVRETWDMHRKPGNQATLDQFTSALRFEAKDYGQRSQTTAQKLASVHVPTLVLWGGAGSMLPLSVGCDVARTVGRGDTVMISYRGAGHFLPIEAPGAAQDIAWFLGNANKNSGQSAVTKPESRPPFGRRETCR